MREEIFALDIGTRKVMGIVCRRRGERLELVDAEVCEHLTRPMFDGQIHSIDDVARTVRRITDALESRLGMRLDKAGVAVAGRNLVTMTTAVVRDLAASTEISAAVLRDLELEAVDKIGAEAGKDLSDFYCVGYSPVSYELDGARISAPLGHHARTVSCEVIVTFLPRVVLDSIFAVLRKAKIEATNVTLEPIAAINAIIPAEMRNLNIVLVDIGAGTSDLALVRDGVIFAYGMVPEAGDEITEAVSHRLLVDFQTAEKIKRSLDAVAEIEYQDIWARPHRVRTADVKEFLRPAVARLAASIARTALELNGAAPRATVLVGGGSQTSGLISELARSLASPADTIGVRLPAMIEGVSDRTKKLSGPEAVTPIGIGMMTEQTKGLVFIEITVNGEPQVLLDFSQKKDVLGALTFSGIVNEKKLYPHPGLALTATVNGELKIVKGTFGEPAQIRLNGVPVESLSQRVKHGDRIDFIEAVDGRDACALVRDLVQPQPVTVTYNGRAVTRMPTIIMNNAAAGLDDAVADRSQITVAPLTADGLLESQGVALAQLSEREITVTVDGVPRIIPQRNFTLTANGRVCGRDVQLLPGDAVEFAFGAPTHYRIKDIVDTSEGPDSMHITVDGRDIVVTIDRIQVFMNGSHVSPEEFLIDKADIRVIRIKERSILLSEIFKYVDIDPQKVVGKRIRILVDDMPAGFTTPLAEGSRVRLLFEERN